MKNLIRRYWYLLVLIVILITTIILRLLTPTQTTTPNIDSVQNSYQGVIPGKSTPNEVIEKLGTPLNQDNKDGKTIMNYQSDYAAYPTQVTISGAVVNLIIERIPPTETKARASEFATLGDPEAIGYTKHLGVVFPLHIYASKGIAIARHEQGDVFEVWRFSPMTLTQFFSTTGAEISMTPEGPEPADSPDLDIPTTTTPARK